MHVHISFGDGPLFFVFQSAQQTPMTESIYLNEELMKNEFKQKQKTHIRTITRAKAQNECIREKDLIKLQMCLITLVNH